MDFCLSCLGLARYSSDSENPETSRLLSAGGPYQSYGDQRPYRSHGQMQAHHLPQQDPETLRRDREAFEGICHAMSDEVVDVFTAVPDREGFGGSRVESADALHLATKPSEEETEEGQDDGQEDPDTSFTESETAVPQEMAYRSVKRISKGPLSRGPDKEGG